ncbi:hypothetical protein [Parabacteroides provencensis]|uniref:hypothetical protein n=1 Tax=Parabacteroides provencensis TaxID=1944636 RepID=UPI000C151957|nr:hypothetical protein [Parabacteroides provencensis]
MKFYGFAYLIVFTSYSLYRLLRVVPAAGNRNNSSGSSNNLASNGNYWSSTLTEAGKSPRLNFNSGGANTNAEVLSYGFSVRCVQAFTSHSFYYLCLL